MTRRPGDVTNPHRNIPKITPAFVGKSFMRGLAYLVLMWVAAMTWTKYG